MVQPKLIIHGGAGSSLKGGKDAVRKSLFAVLEAVYSLLSEGTPAAEAAVRGAQLLEDDSLFNAGTGSVLQSDGQIRMSASLMDGARQRFSGVINASRVQNPIFLAEFLQSSPDRVLSDLGAAELLRELKVPSYDVLTEKRLKEWIEDRNENFNRAMANVVSEEAGRGTIGVVALDREGVICAATSTGGKGFERIGRVSDSAMPAGNYASARAGVSCTGIGEDIIDECLAARIVIRVEDGLSLGQAMERSFREAGEHGRDLGAIALDARGTIAWGKTSEVLLGAFHAGGEMGDTLDLPDGVITGYRENF